MSGEDNDEGVNASVERTSRVPSIDEKTLVRILSDEGAAGSISSNPSNFDIDVDDETMVKLRGDSIGDTIFSEAFILKTMLKLQDVSFDKDLEDDLTFLWDITMESAVCNYLNEAGFAAIACAIIEVATEERLLEILVGILANILCNGQSIVMIEKHSSEVIKLLSSDDHLILIQVFRFIKALAFTTSSMDFLTVDDIQKIDFILNNSRNLELLMGCSDALANLTLDKRLIVSKVNGRLGLSSVVAHETIEELLEVDLSENDNNFNKDVMKATNYLLGVLVNLLTYEDNRIATEMEADSNKIIHYLFSLTTKTLLGYEEFITNNQSCLDFLVYVISCFNFVCKQLFFKLDTVENMLKPFSLYKLKVVEKLQDHYDEFMLNFVLNLTVKVFLEKYRKKKCRHESINELIENVALLKESEIQDPLFKANVEEILEGLSSILKDSKKTNN